MTILSLNRQLIPQSYALYSHDLAALARFEAHKARIGAMYHEEERRILYLMTRRLCPEVVVEFSPNKGWSTLHLAQALETNGRGHIHSFELDPANITVAQQALAEYGLTHRVTFYAGDVRNTLPPLLAAWGQSIDFLFVDSNHSYDFARWWLADVLPSVRPGGLVHVHDIEYSHQFGWNALMLTHLGKGVYGDPPRRFVRVHPWQRSLLHGRWSRLAPRQLREALVPKHALNAIARPHYFPGNSVADLNSWSGPGEALAVKEYLDKHPQTSWLSVMALIENDEYRAAVAPYGGGAWMPWPDPWGYQRSPTLYFIKEN